MPNKWLQKIVFRSAKRSNLPETAGAVLLMLSFTFPWFYGTYRFSGKYVSGAEMLFGPISGKMTPPLFAVLVLAFLFLLPVYSLIRREPGNTFLAALAGIILLVVMVVFYPVQPWHFCIGSVLALAGLALMAAGLYRAR